MQRRVAWGTWLVGLGLAAVGCGETGAEVELIDARLTEPVSCPGHAPPARSWAADVVSTTIGPGGGFGADALPEVVLGPPEGAGERQGSLDVVSLGRGGQVVVELSADAIDCDGDDLVVFENAFALGSQTFVELARVEVSLDARRWVAFPCDPSSPWPHPGCAGVRTVQPSTPGADLGGDAFDLAELGVTRVRYVRLTDLGVSNGPAAPPTVGFDLDAVGIVDGHGEEGEGGE